jgi:hypothetical protein
MALTSFYASPQSADSPDLKHVLQFDFDFKLNEDRIYPKNLPRYSDDMIDLMTTIQTGGLYKGWFVWNTPKKTRVPAFVCSQNPTDILEKHLGQSMRNLIYMDGVCISPDLYNTPLVSEFCSNLKKGITIDGLTLTLFEDDFVPSQTPMRVRVVANTSANHMKLLLSEMYGCELSFNINRTILDEDNTLYHIEFVPKIYTANCHLISGCLKQNRVVQFQDWFFHIE